LYYALVNNTLLFGSEIKTILASGLVSRQIDPQAIDAFFTYTFIPAPLSIFSDIRKLPPGCLIEVQNGEHRIRRYWDADFSSPASYSEEEWSERLTTSLNDAVKCHLIADVEVGSFLS